MESSISPAPTGKSRRSPTFRFAIVVLVLGLATGMLLRTDGMLLKRHYYHDEAISFIAATGHENAYQDAAYAGGMTDRWVTAGQWKALMEPAGFWVFGGIQSGLARTDMHPPLYFWVLHVWTAVFGVTPRTGVVLNLIIATLTALSLFVLARRWLGDELEAAVVAAIWFASPPVVATSMMARHYDLVALFTVLLALAVTRAADTAKPLRARDLVLLAAVASAGMLTHYQFVLVILTGAAYAVIILVKRDRRRLLKTIGGMLAGVPLFLLLDPTFYLSVARHGGRPHSLTADVFVARLRTVRQSLASFFGLDAGDLRWAAWSWHSLATRVKASWPPLSLPARLGGVLDSGAESLRHVIVSGAAIAAIAATLLLLIAAAALCFPRSRVVARRYLGSVDTKGVLPALVFLAGVAGSIIVMYLLVRAPFIYDRYLAAGWPFLAFVPVLAARLLVGRLRYVAIVAFCFIFLMPATMGRVHSSLGGRHADSVPTLARAGRLVFDTQTRGNISRAMSSIPDDKLVYVSTLSGLLADRPPWLPELRPNDVYVAFHLPANSPRDFAAMKSLLSQRFVLVRTGYRTLGVGDTYLLSPSP